MDNTRDKGRHYEDMALDYLLKRGFECVARNFYTRYGEIDLIMKKDNVLHFVEVKSSSYMDPFLKIDSKKLNRIIKSIDIYMQKNNIDCNFCIDAIGIHRDNVLFLENITI